MRRIQIYPGNTGFGGDITIPTAAPDIDTVEAAEITRMPLAQGNALHTDANVALAFDDHVAADVAACIRAHTPDEVIAAFDIHGAGAVALGVDDHTQAQVVACIADHPDHAHDLGVIVGVVAAGEHYGASAGGATDLGATTGKTIPGGVPATGGVLDNAAVQNHTVTGTDLTHVAGVNVDHVADEPVPHVGVADLEHAANNPLVHGAAADPVVAVPALTKQTTRTVRFTAVNILDGDLVTLVYQEIGEVVHAS